MAGLLAGHRLLESLAGAAARRCPSSALRSAAGGKDREMAGLSDQRIVKISKYLSRHLRHQPDRLGLRLQPGGWVDVTELLQACRVADFALTRGELDEVVARSDKRRFGYDPTGRRIRALARGTASTSTCSCHRAPRRPGCFTAPPRGWLRRSAGRCTCHPTWRPPPGSVAAEACR